MAIACCGHVAGNGIDTLRAQTWTLAQVETATATATETQLNAAAAVVVATLANFCTCAKGLQTGYAPAAI